MRVPRPWIKPNHPVRGMGVSVVAEGVAPLVCACYKFCDPMLVEVVASPLRVSLDRCRG